MQVLLRSAAITFLTVTAISTLHAPPAVAAPVTGESATEFGRLLDSPGVYLDAKTGGMVITVTNKAAANRVKAYGAISRIVPRDTATLNAAIRKLDREFRIPGTSWGVDPVINKVVLTVDSTVTGTALTRIRAGAARLGDAVHIEQVPGAISTRIAGGDPIYRPNGRCSLGFHVHDGVGKSFFLTAGHCGVDTRTMYSDTARRHQVGTRSSAYFPGDDYAIYHFVPGRTSNFGVVNNGQDITRAGNAYKGQQIYRSGWATGTRAGFVLATNVTLNLDEGTVYNLVHTTACAEAGDSGGPVYAGTTALGLVSAGRGSCASPAPEMWFQPISEPLDRYDVHVF
ncbi:S1 family peptidase [Phytohabitans flavus]|uniref:S1 family peptidase n=1 Tax=Phytohabitans flavus TaxID=1076124 RepID=UPI0031E84DEF